MSYYRRRPNDLDNLLRWRRNVFLQAPDGGYVLVGATPYFVVLHTFDSHFRQDPSGLARLDLPDGLYDGQGWNLDMLNDLLAELLKHKR
jgi:hypothetical protein